LLAGLLLPLAFSTVAAPINNRLPANVQQALAKASCRTPRCRW
jgi:D-alanyl-D-alanine carboxypeptidase/D-alanyl-D-alanine-endopeptidase (penicillin-binding protein 4)